MGKTRLIKQVLLFTVLLCLTFGQIAPSYAQNQCLSYFGALFSLKSRVEKIKSINGYLKPNLIEEWANDLTPHSSTEYSVRIEPLKGYDNLIVFRKDDKAAWGSRASTLPGGEDIQGTPVVNFKALGPYTAFALNLRAVDKNTMVVPNAKLYSQSIVALSNELKNLGYAPIPFSFYEQKTSSLEAYARNLIKGLSLPVASLETPGHFVHDVSFHYAAILMPVPYMEALLQKVDFTTQVIEHLKTHLQNKKIASLLKPVIKNISLYRAHIIDNTTANVGVLGYYKDHKKYPHLFDDAVKEFLINIFRYEIPDDYLYNLDQHHLEKKDELLIIRNLIQDYANRPEIMSQYPLINQPNDLQQPKTFEESVVKRRQELEEAALELLIKKTR